MGKAGRLVTALLLVGALAGCVEDGFEAASARGVPDGTPAEAGGGEHVLAVRVTDGPGGAALADASVAVSWRDGRALALRTDDEGMAVARVPADTIVSVSAYASGFTEELVDGYPTGVSSARSDLAVPLYRETIEYVANGTLGPGDVSGYRLGVDSYHWVPQDALFGASSEAQAAYMARLVELEVTLSWANSATGFGDLGIGAGASTGSPQVVADSDEQATPGEYEEALQLGFTDIYDLGWRDSQTLLIGPGTGTGYFAPIGLGYTLQVRARFEGDVDRDRGVPAPGFLPVLGLLALATLAVRRSR